VKRETKVLEVKRSANEEFYRRFTSCEERKDRLATPWSGAFRWFASSNVAKLEDYRPAGEMAGILSRLRERRRDDMAAAIAKVLSKANRKQG
jgi:hypothetical protein